jgi:hypothetical protein
MNKPAEVSQRVGVFDIVMKTPAEVSQRVGVFAIVIDYIQDIDSLLCS